MSSDNSKKPTSFFDPAGREQWAAAMKAAGYVELPGYEVSDHVYCCGNCPWMKADPASPTSYWCAKYGFPDRPNGCCDGWEPKPANNAVAPTTQA